VECDSVADVAEAVEAGADLVLLDNMPPDAMRAAVELTKPAGVRTEASGGLTLDRAAEVAGTGVDYLAVGALTHSAPVLDIALDLRALDPRALDLRALDLRESQGGSGDRPAARTDAWTPPASTDD
jgi:nicotinate-nucleotide pyrophosphorylase (carboxylating)